MPWSKEDGREYYQKNRDRINAARRARWETKKESENKKRREDKELQKRHLEYNRLYRATPEGQKERRLSNWKTKGLVGDYDAIYEIYLKTTNCMRCSIQFSEETRNTRKCMDHDHETNEYRQMICHHCNITLPRQKSKVSHNV